MANIVQRRQRAPQGRIAYQPGMHLPDVLSENRRRARRAQLYPEQPPLKPQPGQPQFRLGRAGAVSPGPPTPDEQAALHGMFRQRQALDALREQLGGLSEQPSRTLGASAARQTADDQYYEDMGALFERIRPQREAALYSTYGPQFGQSLSDYPYGGARAMALGPPISEQLDTPAANAHRQAQATTAAFAMGGRPGYPTQNPPGLRQTRQTLPQRQELAMAAGFAPGDTRPSGTRVIEGLYGPRLVGPGTDLEEARQLGPTLMLSGGRGTTRGAPGTGYGPNQDIVFNRPQDEARYGLIKARQGAVEADRERRLAEGRENLARGIRRRQDGQVVTLFGEPPRLLGGGETGGGETGGDSNISPPNFVPPVDEQGNVVKQQAAAELAEGLVGFNGTLEEAVEQLGQQGVSWDDMREYAVKELYPRPWELWDMRLGGEVFVDTQERKDRRVRHYEALRRLDPTLPEPPRFFRSSTAPQRPPISASDGGQGRAIRGF